MKELLFLKKYLLKYKRQLIVGFVFIVLTNIFTTVSPRILGFAIDSIKEDSSYKILASYAGILLIIALVQGIFRYYMRQIVIGVSRWIEYDLRNDFFAHLEKLSMNFYLNNKTGDIMSRATNDLNAVRMVLGPGIMYSITTITMFIMAVSLMFSIHAWLTLYALLPFPLLTFLISRFGILIHKRYEKVQAQFASLSARLQENLAGIRVIKVYTREEGEIEEFRKENENYFQKSRSLIRVWSVFFPIMEFMGGLGIVIVLWYGGIQVIEGRISLGDFVAFNGYLLLLLWPVIALGWVISLFQRGAVSMKRMTTVFNTEPDIRDTENVIDISAIGGNVVFKNLSFTYKNNNERVLKNINLDIKAGMTLGIVGPTGSGKTTLVNLIPRVSEPPENSLFIDNVPVERIPLGVLRSHIGYVPQDTFIFSDTIKENIAFGIQEVDEDRIKEAAEISQLSNDIDEFPDGYDTLLGERGINLSGGQKQRLSIARAIIRQPRILILDDALSSIDTYTEEEILRRLKVFMKGRTSIIISHRMSTIKVSDLVVVLDDGEIVEQGKHQELLDKEGMYANLHRKQLIAEELERE